MSGSSSHSHHQGHELRDKFKIVSTQSTARPGAIIELEGIADATQNWQNTLMLHSFQEQLILAQSDKTSSSNSTAGGFFSSRMSAIVDLQQNTTGFREPFYTLVAETTSRGVLMHMWRFDIASHSMTNAVETSGSITPDEEGIEAVKRAVNAASLHQACQVHVATEKVCTQRLPLPDGVDVIHAVPAVGHLSSASIYPACLAPYVMVTACTDGKIRFWCVRMTPPEEINANRGYDGDSGAPLSTHDSFSWEEWRMESATGKSEIEISGRLVSVSAAFSGRIACAYQSGHSFQRPREDPEQRYVNLCVAIYECESTGGAEWILEDTLSLKNIEIQSALPSMDAADNGFEGKRHLDKFAQHFQQDQDGEELKKNLKGKEYN